MPVKHQRRRRRKWQNAQRTVRTHLPSRLPTLLFLTDPRRTPHPASLVTNLPAETAVIYRHFGAPEREYIARDLLTACQQRGLVLLIAADPKLARRLGADGVHWPEKRLADARQWRGGFALQTASAHSRQAVATAAKVGMDAVLYSTIFASKSASATSPIGPLKLRKLCQHAPCPIYGLGGIDANTAGRIATSAGLAAIGGLVDVYGR